MSVSSKQIYGCGPFVLEPHARRLSRDGEPVPLGAVDADGRNPMQLMRGTYDSEVVFSPDSESVIYVAEDGHVPKLRRVPINGGDAVPLTDEFSQHPIFSPDGKMLVYYRMNQKQRDQRHLVFIPAQGGERLS